MEDSGYLNIHNYRNALSEHKYSILKRLSTTAKLPEEEQELAQAIKTTIAKIRVKAEHAYNPIKHTLYKGLKKNSAKNNIMCALANVWLISRHPRMRTA